MSDLTHAAARPSARHYVRVWGVLTLLLVVSVVGPMVGIPLLTLITAFGIALVKAYLVAKNFMHLNVEKRVVHWALGLALLFMVVLYAGVAPDVQKSEGQQWRKSGEFHYVSEAARGAAHGGADDGQGAAGH